MDKIWKKRLALFLTAVCIAVMLLGCTNNTNGSSNAEPNASSTDSAEVTIPESTEATNTAKKDYYVHSRGKTFQEFTFDYQAVAAAYNVDDAYTYQDLGQMQLEEYPIDGVYDTAFNVIKVGDTYKMWWCRACPFDTIWYAESKDMKNWYNAQCVIDLNGYETTWVKQMLSWPSVLYVNEKYHMFFEAPAKIAESGEYSNNIFYASSKDGLNWTFYPNNKDPQPVIKDPVVREGVYGVGQPKAFYMDGYFYVTYTDASQNGGNIRFARSKGNGYSFEGDSAYDHTLLISNVAGAAMRYNSANKKYYLMFTMSSTQSDGVYNDNLYIMESDDPYTWPYTTRAQALAKATCLTDPSVVTKKTNIDLVTDAAGIVTDEDMDLLYMDGVMPSESEDHRNTHTTWDGHIAVVGVGSQYGKTLILPNGKEASEENLKWYYDQVAIWTRPTVSVANGTPTIDGKKDSVYNDSETVLVETVTWSYEYSKPTATTGKVNASWDQDALYVYAEVADSTGPNTGYSLEKPANLWRNDSVTFFVDVFDTKTGTTNSETLTPVSFMIIIDASGTIVFKDSSETVVSNEFSGYEVKTETISGGYIIEAKIPWYDYVKDQVKSGKTIGFDVQINDSFDDSIGRQAQVFWSDYAGDSFQYLDRWGQLKLK